MNAQAQALLPRTGYHFRRLPAETRLWATVQKGGQDDCWLWIGGVDRTKYGRIYVDGKVTGAHRAAWAVTFGPIPDGMHVLHKCDNSRCVNPRHLFLGTHRDNMRDMIAKGRAGLRRGPGIQTYCKRGHVLAKTAEYNKNGTRFCGICKRAVRRQWLDAQRRSK